MNRSPKNAPRHLSMDDLLAGVHEIRQSPKDEGRLLMIACRPSEGEREVLGEARLDEEVGLVGDNWKARGNTGTADGSAKPDTQVTIMNGRAADLVAAGDRSRWALAGDQLYVDFDLGEANLSAGSRLGIGGAVVEVTAEPHNGCRKFVNRFGLDAMKFVNSPVGKQLHLRGVNARVVRAGDIRAGDAVRKI